MERDNMDLFMKFMARGRSLVACAVEGDLEGFEKIFTEDKKLQNVMFWHVQKAFKEAIKYRKLFIVEFIVEELDIKLSHECFFGYFHRVLRTFTEADEARDEVE